MVAKFLSIDPLTSSFPWYTPYQFAGNMPIRFVDLDGLEQYDYLDKFVDETIDATIEYVTDKTVKASVRLLTDFSKYMIVRADEKYDIKAESAVSLEISTGLQGGIILKNLMGLDIDVGSEDVFKIEGTFDWISGEFKPWSVSSVGENGEVTTHTGWAFSIPLEEYGIPLSYSGSKSTTEVKDIVTGEIKEQTKSAELGLGTIIGMSVYKNDTENYEKEKVSNSSTEYGISIANGGATLSAEYSLDIKFTGLTVSVTKNETND